MHNLSSIWNSRGWKIDSIGIFVSNNVVYIGIFHIFLAMLARSLYNVGYVLSLALARSIKELLLYVCVPSCSIGCRLSLDVIILFSTWEHFSTKSIISLLFRRAAVFKSPLSCHVPHSCCICVMPHANFLIVSRLSPILVVTL